MPEPSPLIDMRIAAPCPARWEDMEGDDQVRHCALCRKNVWNFSAMPRKKIQQLRAEPGERCIRFYRRPDGTVLTTNCPVGLRRLRRCVALVFGIVFAGFTFVAATFSSEKAAVRLRASGYALAWWVAPEEKPVEYDSQPYDGVTFDKANECHYTGGLEK